MISEGSCDTEDWSNDAENSALITKINHILQYNLNYSKLLYVCVCKKWSKILMLEIYIYTVYIFKSQS